VPVDYAAVRPLLGSITPRNAPGRSVLVQFLIGLTEPAALEVPGLAEVLYECIVGLIRQRLGEASGITSHTRRLLQRTHIAGVIRRSLGNPALDPEEIAKAANVSPRYLYSLFQDAELPPMRFLKNVRLQEARRRLEDPALASTPISDIMSAVGYSRSDQFARDFRQMFGASPKDHRQSSCARPTS
jgi:AraC-like DNA-binding protein